MRYYSVHAVILGVECIALLDSGASEHFIADRLVTRLRLRRRKLRQPFMVRAAKGAQLPVTQYTRVTVHLADVPIRLNLRIVVTPLELILAPFIHNWNPIVNWRDKTMVFRHNKGNGQEFSGAGSKFLCDPSSVEACSA